MRPDVLVKGGHIEAIGRFEGIEGVPVIEAAGRAVTPGFVDIHRHNDVAVFRPCFGAIELSQGLTTIAGGNCGFTMTPNAAGFSKDLPSYMEPVQGACPDAQPYFEIKGYLERIRRTPLPLNVTNFLGLSAVRIALKGFSPDRWTPQEIEAAQRYVREAVEYRMPGITSGFAYIPETYSTADEVIEMLSPAADKGMIYAVHMRNEGGGLVASVRDVLDIARRARMPLQISHFKMIGPGNWNRVLDPAIEEIERARASGQDVMVDFYPYTGTATTMAAMLPSAFVAGDIGDAIRRLGTPEGVDRFRMIVRQEPGEWANVPEEERWSRYPVGSANLPENKNYIGRSISDCVREGGFEDGFAFISYILHSEQGKVGSIGMSISEAEMLKIAKLLYAMVISDALNNESPTPHPRLIGAFARIIDDFVRRRRIYTLPEAIKKMSAMPAKRLRLFDRGFIAPGAAADLAIFDPEHVRDNATFADPMHLSTGFDYVIVGGNIAFQQEQVQGHYGRSLV